MRRLNKDRSGHEALQQAVDWMFLLTVEWFGLPDDMKKHTEQLEYGFKGHSNDELRQIWMSTAVPLCNELELQIPAHYDPDQQKYVLDCPFPAHFDAPVKHWLLEDGSCTWDDVIKRWKARGPKNEEFVGMIQRGKKEMLRLLEQES
jgi:ring-1,2-phenylacetyl-CoA epoxidase subunit PaaA